ncbi:hypothetical protein H634G_09149 [Metarhizium anisopliae BRIP 53293]|uniref:Uncharacterized protein n=1 Tax=Metarhizium anisopliae BRIP 53293 TaxID=1291518 RepID=A0A0D9NT32_METAN|nr:hypothetical protein H634G_09149 [Metarhizium anisopliae BRIP 53293]
MFATMPQPDSTQHGNFGDRIARNPCGTRVQRKAPVAAADGETMRLEASPQPIQSSGRQPEAGSLNAILREHRVKRLYVPTIAWTGDQVRLLNMAFEKVDVRISKPQQSLGDKLGESVDAEQLREDERHWPSSDAIVATRGLLLEGADRQKLAMRALLAEFGFVPSRGTGANGFRSRNVSILKAAKVEFQFGDKTVNHLRPDDIFEMNSGGVQLVAYANFETISIFRKRHSRGRARKLQLIQPAEACEDPYIMGILIGLAQHQQRRGGSQRECEGEGGQRVTLMGIPTREEKRLYVYTTRIPDKFLAKLERPSQRSDCDRVVVKYESISLIEPQRAVRRMWLALRRNLPMLKQPQGWIG